MTEADLLHHVSLVKLREQGHMVEVLLEDGGGRPFGPYDLVIGRRAWYMDVAHLERYLDVALKAARARRYPKEPDSEDE